MKKSYLILAAVAGLFASCAQNEDLVQIVDEPVEIGFVNGFVNNVTRAELLNGWFTTDGNQFGVYGFKGTDQLFGSNTAAEAVTWEASKSDWTHPTVRFWDKSADNYAFYAYAPLAATHTFSADKKYSFTGISLIKDITEANADLAISTPLTGQKWDGNCTTTGTAGHGVGHVEFTFNHILSKLSFKVKTDVEASVATIKLNKIDLDFPTATSVSWAQTAATAVAGATTFTGYTAKDAVNTTTGEIDYTKYETSVFDGTFGDLTSTAQEPTDSKTFIVAPVNTTQTTHEFGVKVEYTITYADSKIETAKATGVISYSPAQNTYQVVIININPAAIEFCVKEINNWTPATDTTIEVN